MKVLEENDSRNFGSRNAVEFSGILTYIASVMEILSSFIRLYLKTDTVLKVQYILDKT